jgi:hypothetical protein
MVAALREAGTRAGVPIPRLELRSQPRDHRFELAGVAAGALAPVLLERDLRTAVIAAQVLRNELVSHDRPTDVCDRAGDLMAFAAVAMS